MIPLSSGYVAVQLHRLPIDRQCLAVSVHLAQSQTGVEQVVSLLALRVGQLTVQFQDLPECGQCLVVPARHVSVNAIDMIKLSGSATTRAFVVETMGR